MSEGGESVYEVRVSAMQDDWYHVVLRTTNKDSAHEFGKQLREMLNTHVIGDEFTQHVTVVEAYIKETSY